MTLEIEIPRIDISLLRQGKGGADNVCTEIRKAFTSSGFLCITNHGIPEDSISKALEVVKDFFNCPLNEKQEYSACNSSKYRGYTRLGGPHDCAPMEGKLERKESFCIGATGTASPMHGENQWPRSINEFEGTITTLWNEMLNLSHLLAKGLALALNIDEHFFQDKMKDPVAQMVCLRYPGNPDPKASDNENGCGAHTDCGFLTLVIQNEVCGLEIQSPNGTWIDVLPEKGDIIVNIGDLAQRWSNDVLVSTTHRVRIKSTLPRYSIVFFCNADYEAIVDPIISGSGEGKRYPRISAGEYLVQKLGLMYNPNK